MTLSISQIVITLNGTWSYMPSALEFWFMVVLTMLIEFTICIIFMPKVKGERQYITVFLVVLFANVFSGSLGYWMVYR